MNINIKEIPEIKRKLEHFKHEIEKSQGQKGSALYNRCAGFIMAIDIIEAEMDKRRTLRFTIHDKDPREAYSHLINKILKR